MSKSSTKSIDKVTKSNFINKKITLLLKNKLCNKKQAKKDTKEKQKQDKIIIARAILKAKKQKTLNKEIHKNK